MTGVRRGVREAVGGLRRGLPLPVQQGVLAVAYRSTGALRFGLARARVLEALGRRDEAVGAYRAIEERLAAEPTIAARQAHQFATHAGLHRLGATDVVDPLFDVEIRGAGMSSRRQPDGAVGTFRVTTPFLGLRLRGAVDRRSAQGRDVVGVEVVVDGVGIRPLTLPARGSSAGFDLLIRRPALARFPTRSALSVRTLRQGGLAGSSLRFGADEHAVCLVPHGDGSIIERASAGPAVDKKGRLRSDGDALRRQQDAYLALYVRANAAFERLFGRPLFLLYGTLLGRYRDGEFIPGDDDFDVGYVSFQTRAEAVKAEAVGMMRRLVEAGFEVSVNRRGKPFRLRAPDSPLDLHLDARPVWRQQGRVWAHKQAALDLPLEGFANVERVAFRDIEAVIPRATEAFLRAYYGDGWRVPDPGFSNDSTVVPAFVRRNLARVCLAPDEIVALERELERVPGRGRFSSIATHDLYPLDVFERRIGW